MSLETPAKEAPTKEAPAKQDDDDITLFTLETPKSKEELDLSWESFRHPKLPRCPFGIRDLTFMAFLGKGIDGSVFKAQYEGKIIAFKIATNKDNAQFYNNKRPGIRYYWAFERECMNAALLEKIGIRLRESRATQKSIYVYPAPTTRRQALYNQRAFSDEGRIDESHPPHPGMEPLPLNYDEDININPCYGWLAVPAEGLRKMLRWRERVEINDFGTTETYYYAIAYEYVSGGGDSLDVEKVIRQQRFFNLVGFSSVAFNYNNWRGDSTLIDMADLISPARGSGWHAGFYAHENEGIERWTRSSFSRISDMERQQFSWRYPDKELLDFFGRPFPPSTFKLD